MDPTFVIVGAFFVGLGLWLVFFGVVVYHGWVHGDHPWAVRTRRRIFWHGIRGGIPYAWTLPGAVPIGLGSIAWGISAWLITGNPRDGVAIALAMVGFPLIFIPAFLSWRRVRWFLAPWHRTEVEREAAGLEPLVPMPAEGPQMMITRRAQLFGLALAAACLVVWWVAESIPFLIGASYMFGLIGALRVIDRQPPT